jgi:hypothetical protein
MRTQAIFLMGLLFSSSIVRAQTPNSAGNGDATVTAVDSRIFAGARAGDDYEGKRLAFPVNIEATLLYDKTKSICLPPRTRLRGMSQLTAAGVLVRLRDEPSAKDPDYWCRGKLIKQADLVAVYPETLIVSKVDVDAVPANISGLSYGVLVVPFKYHIRGSKEFKGSGSVGPYAGYKTESGNWAASVEFVGFLGLTNVAVERNIDGKPITDNVSGISYGGGMIGRITDKFQVGLLLGADRVGKSVNYVDNGKLWIAVSVGYAFSN